MHMTPLSKVDAKNLVSLGYAIWEDTYKHTDDDSEALDRLKNTVGKRVSNSEVHSLEGVCLLLCSARWVQQGSPTIILDDLLAASLMATDIGLESAELIEPPWKAFSIEIPPGLITYDFDTKVKSYQRILVQRASYDNGHHQWLYWVKEETENEGDPGIFAKATTKKMILDDWNLVDQLNSQQSRAAYLVGRLILGLCLALSDPTTTSLREQKRSKGRGNRFRTPHNNPDPRNFIVGRPITVDCRPAIRDFMTGVSKKSSSINVQTLVRGHWKHQAHGVGRALRKLIHIEPYWKGPEEAKILLRSLKVI